MNKQIQLEDLVGRHILTGYGRDRAPADEDDYYNEDVNVFYFTLDSITYVAREDPEDGYRSCMRDLTITDNLPTSYIRIPPATVDCKMGIDDERELLFMRDIISDLTVCIVGTDEVDDYYPCFIDSVSPENLYYNRPEHEHMHERLEVAWDDIELFQ